MKFLFTALVTLDAVVEAESAEAAWATAQNMYVGPPKEPWEHVSIELSLEASEED